MFCTPGSLGRGISSRLTSASAPTGAKPIGVAGGPREGCQEVRRCRVLAPGGGPLLPLLPALALGQLPAHALRPEGLGKLIHPKSGLIGGWKVLSNFGPAIYC